MQYVGVEETFSFSGQSFIKRTHFPWYNGKLEMSRKYLAKMTKFSYRKVFEVLYPFKYTSIFGSVQTLTSLSLSQR
jgi:hypothetical protein